MRLLVSGCTRTMKRLVAVRPDRLGVLLTPQDWGREWWPPGVPWACDNGCFGGLDAAAMLRMLARVITFDTRPLWVACPDVVGDAAETLRLFGRWQPLMAEVGMPVAIVGQDGLTAGAVPWADAAALFVGGSTAWKLSDAAAALTLAARDRGLAVHYGRVNSMRRIVWIGRGMRDGRLWCDTIDGGSASRWGEANIPKLVRWIDAGLACRQTIMFGGNA